MQRVASIAVLLSAVRMFTTNPEAKLKTGIWCEPFWTRTEFQKWFSDSLNKKINREDPRRTWRKFQTAYQWDMAADAQRVNEYARRIRHSGCRGLLRLQEFKDRYPHIDNQENA